MNHRAIGVFDSGLGGLTVLKELQRQLPHEDFEYFGDTARVPYGSREPETIRQYCMECASFLLQRNIKLLVVACNTASAVALHVLQESLPIPVVGVIVPGAMACRRLKYAKIGVIGTEVTIASGAYKIEIQRLCEGVKVREQACPLFVPLVEEGYENTEAAVMIASQYLKPLLEEGVQAIVMGCTHYPLLESTLKKVAKGVCWINPALETASMVQSLLRECDLENTSHHEGRACYYVTDEPEKFQELAGRLAGMPLTNVEKVCLAQSR